MDAAHHLCFLLIFDYLPSFVFFLWNKMQTDGSKHSDQQRCSHDVQSSRPTSTPTCHSVWGKWNHPSLIVHTAPTSTWFIKAANHRQCSQTLPCYGNEQTGIWLKRACNQKFAWTERKRQYLSTTDTFKPMQIPASSSLCVWWWTYIHLFPFHCSSKNFDCCGRKYTIWCDENTHYEYST